LASLAPNPCVSASPRVSFPATFVRRA
jgi:hypothetical protein